MNKPIDRNFEIKMFNGEVLYFEFKSIVVCNKNIKEALEKGYVEIEAPKPFIIITNSNFTDEQVEILEDASIADCLKLYKFEPAFGGVLM